MSWLSMMSEKDRAEIRRSLFASKEFHQATSQAVQDALKSLPTCAACHQSKSTPPNPDPGPQPGPGGGTPPQPPSLSDEALLSAWNMVVKNLGIDKWCHDQIPAEDANALREALVTFGIVCYSTGFTKKSI